MDKQLSIADKQKKLWVSITGYRALIILKALMENPCTVDELVDILKHNIVTEKSYSKDTVRISINTLKSAGCKFKRPSKKNNYTYELEFHPFGLKLTNEELNILNSLRDIVSESLNWQAVIKLNQLYEKLIKLTNNSEQIEMIYNLQPMGKINEKILYELSNPKLAGKKIQITYNSSANEKENLEVVPYKIIYENKKVYLWCYIFKYKSNTLLNIEKILKINSISIANGFEINNTYEVFYEVKNAYLNGFEIKDYEEILDIKDDSFFVKANVSNEFWFIQRILQLGSDFKIISPSFFKQKLINKIKMIQQRYKEEC